MKVSVIISTYDRQEDLVECVRSLLHQFEPPDEILIVDDGDDEATERRLGERGLLDRVEHVTGPREGLPASRNAGIDLASGDIVCFIDDDVVLPPTWLREILETYDRTEDASGVGGHVLNFNPDGINKANMDSFGYRALSAARQLFLNDRVGMISPVGILWAPHTLLGTGERDVEVLQGCNMTFRKEVFDHARFDEWYGTSGSSACEELDFCARLAAGGHRLVYNPRATVVHKRSTGATPRDKSANYGSVANLSYFLRSNPSFGSANVALFSLAVVAYALLNLDPEYVRQVAEGARHYRERPSGPAVELAGKKQETEGSES